MSFSVLINCLFLTALPGCINGCISQSSSRTERLDSGVHIKQTTASGNIVGPANTVAVVGSTATFNCTTANSENTSRPICWYRYIAQLSDIDRWKMLTNEESVTFDFQNTFSVKLFAANQVTSQLTLNYATQTDAGIYRCDICSNDKEKVGAELIVIDSWPVCTKIRQHNSSVVQVSVRVTCSGRCLPVLQCSRSLTDQRQTAINYSVTNTTNVTTYNVAANVTAADVDENFSCNVSFNTSLNVTANNNPSYPCRWLPAPNDDGLSTVIVLVFSSSAVLVVFLSFIAICHCVHRGSLTVGCHKTDTNLTQTNSCHDETTLEYNHGAGVYDEIAPVPLPRCTNLPDISQCSRQACQPTEPSEPLVYAELQPKRTPNKNAARANKKAKTSSPAAATSDQTYAAIDHNRRAY